MRLLILTLCLAVSSQTSFAQATDSIELRKQEMLAFLDSADKTIAYQTGDVKVQDFAVVTVPAGYKFIPDSTARWIVTSLWENPADAASSVVGMLVPKDYALTNFDAWAFVMSWDESGYVKDKDANDIDYDDMLKEIQDGEKENNTERTAAGYSTIHLVGWASKPFYDGDNKVLHWAKELEFDGEGEHTLNYDVRILGRKGVLSMNAVGSMDQLADIKQHIPEIVHIARFTDGNRYTDFDPGVDKVAAYTIGGLVAGKLLAKAGLIALLLKNIKLVALALFGIFAAGRKKIARLFSKKKEDDEYTTGTPAIMQTLDKSSTDVDATSSGEHFASGMSDAGDSFPEEPTQPASRDTDIDPVSPRA